MPTNKTPEIKTMVILHSALLFGQVLFITVASIVVFFSQTIDPVLADYSYELIVISLIAGLVSFMISKTVFQKKLNNIKQGQITIQEKVEYYRSASILRWAIIEAATLLTIVLFLLTQHYFIMAIASALIIIFFSKRPSLEMVAADLSIPQVEIQQMERPS
ncbi:MAG: hypothetical protein ABIP35_11645 [Ginsengibacter sp.]